MTRVLHVSSLTVALLAFSTCARSQCNYTNLPSGFAEIATTAHDRVTKGELPSIAIAVAQHGRILCEEAFGWADREKQISASPNTVYAAGSVAKAITGAGIFILVDKGRIQLDDTAEQYGVHVRTYQRTGLTIEELLSMTAGIQHGWFYDYGSSLNRKELVDHYAIGAFPPGQYFIYSNFSFGILGEVIEHVDQSPFREFMRTELLDPLGMTSSGFNLTGSNVAVGYQAGKAVPSHAFEPEAGGGLYTSAHDLALFGMFQLDPEQKLISPKLLMDMHALKTTQQRKSRYTSGWGIFEFKNGSSVYISNGRVLAGSATLLVLPKEDAVITCLTNAASDATDDLAFQFAELFSKGLLANLESTRKEVEASEGRKPFESKESQRGTWVGTILTPKGSVPVRLRIGGANDMQIGIHHGAMVPVRNLGVEQGFLAGEVATGISLEETDNQASTLDLQLLWVAGGHLIGTARVESSGELPRFGLPVYISLTKVKSR